MQSNQNVVLTGNLFWVEDQAEEMGIWVDTSLGGGYHLVRCSDGTDLGFFETVVEMEYELCSMPDQTNLYEIWSR